ncbi:hypothetical protein ACFL54_05130 [Planctomycetota bacterium]
MNNSFNEPRFPIPNPRNGIVLLVVLGMLALMSILALAFVSMTRLERAISLNYVDRTRAVLVAESGVEAALARLSGFSGGVLRPEEYEWMQYNPDDPAAELDHAGKLSFMSSETGPNGIPISGAVGSSYVDDGDYYLLKVEDESGKLNLNDTNAEMDPGDDTSRRLFNIVTNLAEVLFAQDKGAGIGTVIASTLFAERDRLDGRFSTLQQVDDALLKAPSDLTLNDRRKFLSNVTLWSWQDSDVIKPNPPIRRADNPDVEWLEENYTWGIPFMRWQEMQTVGYSLEPRSPVNLNTASPELIEALLRDLSGWSYLEGPAEICQTKEHYGTYMWAFGCNYNYDTLRRDDPRMLAEQNRPFMGRPYVEEGEMYYYGGPSEPLILSQPYGRVRKIVVIPEIAHWLAQDMYEHIHGLDINGDGLAPVQADPIESWPEMKFYLNEIIRRAKTNSIGELAVTDPFQAIETFLDCPENRLPQNMSQGINGKSAKDWGYDRTGDFSYFNQYLRDLILANFDPNTMSNDFNPDQVVFRFTDKADLETYSTEFSFEPTGSFRVQSQGLITNQESLLATCTVQAVVKLFELRRLTSQSQFMRGAIIGDVENYLGSNETFATKWDLQLCSYPEPMVKSLDDPLQYVNNNIYDGRIGLMAIRHESMPDVSKTLWSYFEGGFEATSISGSQIEPAEMEETQSVYDALAGGWPEFDYYLNPFTYVETIKEVCSTDELIRQSGWPGTLHGDGVFSEAWSTPCYPPENHLSAEGIIGAAIFTIKPNFEVHDSTRVRCYFAIGQAGIAGWRPGNDSSKPETLTNLFCWVGLNYFPHRLPMEVPLTAGMWSNYDNYGGYPPVNNCGSS